MPIRLNLFAEAQAAEDLRRRDPVKRAIILGALAVAMMLVWSSSLQVKAMLAKNDLDRIEAQINVRTNEFQQVLNNRTQSVEIKQKLAALRQLTANRLLNGTMLDALQKATMEDVRLTRVKVAQEYARTEETKPRTNANHTLPGKPATTTERIALTLEAKDYALNPGDSIPKFKEMLASSPYFQDMLGKTNEIRLKDLGQPQTGPDGKPFRFFALECRFPEKTR